eukprot:8299428-Prorocentrum_lima.AAC.1
MTSSLVGSEMCIRDRWLMEAELMDWAILLDIAIHQLAPQGFPAREHPPCLLYTSDAADDM